MSENGNNSVYNIVYAKQLFSYFVGITPPCSPRHAHELFSKMGIFREGLATVYYYFCLERAATCQVALQDLDVFPETTFYRHVNRLKQLGLIVEMAKTSASRGGGRRSSVICVPDVHEEDIRNAIVKERRRTTPFFKIAKRVTQLLLDDYISPNNLGEIYRRDVFPVIKETHTSGFNRQDIADEVCRMLKMEGIRIIY